MKPLIGIVSSWNEDRMSSITPHAYVESVAEAGGIPLLIPMVEKSHGELILSKLDGIVFPGGADVDPARYRERPLPKLGKINPRLDELELFLAEKSLKSGLPILGLCRGCQIVNVAAGGTLVQDISSQIGGAMKHRQEAPTWYGTHEVVLDDDSLAFEIFGTGKLSVNSYHHQSVREPGDGLTVTGRALDGIAEVVEARKNFVLLLQWHPEAMWKHDPIFIKPYQALVEASKAF